MRGYSLKENLLDLLYPRRCPVCHGIAPRDRRICGECRKKLPVITSARCRKCGKPVADRQVLCSDCMRVRHLYTQGAGIFRYDDVMRSTVAYFKYKGRQEYGETLGRLMLESSRDLLALWKPDAVIPVPVHAARLAERGYNQAELLAAPLSEGSGIPLVRDLLVREERTKAQKKLGAEDRRRNLSGAFRCARGKAVPGRVLLIDDIYTTGSTVDACAGTLLKAGAFQVFFLTLCIGGENAAES